MTMKWSIDRNNGIDDVLMWWRDDDWCLVLMTILWCVLMQW